MELNAAIQGKEIDGGANAIFWDTVRRKGHANPEQDLMLAVLKDALLNYRKNLRTRNRLFKDDRLWFFTDETDRLFSFESVCAVLGLDSHGIRKRLLAWETEVRDTALFNRKVIQAGFDQRCSAIFQSQPSRP